MVQVKTMQLMFVGAFELLNDKDRLESALDRIVEQINLTKLHAVSHKFEPQGVSIVYLLAESHIAIHTWPELEQGYVTVSSCDVKHMDEARIRKAMSVQGLNTTYAATAVAGTQ